MYLCDKQLKKQLKQTIATNSKECVIPFSKRLHMQTFCRSKMLEDKEGKTNFVGR